MTEITTSGQGDDPRPLPDTVAPGLDLFVAAWLEQWAGAGGSVHLQGEKLEIGYPEYSYSPQFQEQPTDWPEWQRQHRHLSMSATYHSQMRTLSDLLDAIPCAGAALKQHLREHGMGSYFSSAGARQ